MICTIRDVDCCAHTKSLLTQQFHFQSEAWDLICMYIILSPSEEREHEIML